MSETPAQRCAYCGTVLASGPRCGATARVFVVPAVPDFLVHTTGVAVKLSDLSDAELESVARAWASQLRQRAALASLAARKAGGR